MSETSAFKRLIFNRTDKVGLITNIALSVALVLLANGLFLGWDSFEKLNLQMLYLRHNFVIL